MGIKKEKELLSNVRSTRYESKKAIVRKRDWIVRNQKVFRLYKRKGLISKLDSRIKRWIS